MKLTSMIRRGILTPFSLCPLISFATAIFALPMQAAVTPDEARRYAAEQEPMWKAEMARSHIRLFYTDEELAALKNRVPKLDGMGEKWRTSVLQEADRLVRKKVPQYASPAERLASKKETLSPAQYEAALFREDEQLWIRELGADIQGLSIASRIFPDPRYRARLHDMVMAAVSYPVWGISRSQAMADNMDLACSGMAYGISTAYDLERDAFTEEERATIRRVMAERIHSLLVGLYTTYWGKSVESHTWRNVGGLMTAGTAFLGEIPEASEWLAASTLEYQRDLQALNEDGSDFSGLSYWSGHLYVALTAVEGSKRFSHLDSLYYGSDYFKNAASFRLHSSTPGFGGVLTWGDSDYINGLDFYGPQPFLYRFASQYRDGTGQFLANHLPFAPLGGMIVDVETLMWYDPSVAEHPPSSFDTHLSVWDTVTSRSGWGKDDYLLSLKSGVNVRPHSHLDAGAISLNYGGTWFLLSPGYGRDWGADYWDKSGGRWAHFACAAESESTLIVNGRNQRFDSEARGTIDHFISGEKSLWTEVDLKNAYQDVDKIRRRVLHQRGDYILVLDEVASREPATVEWLLQVPPERTTADSHQIVLSDQKHSLRVFPIDSEADFKPRTPKSPKVDIPMEHQKTYALEKKGKEVSFSVILQPYRADAPAESYHSSETAQGGVRTISIRASQWSDTISLGSKSQPQELVPGTGIFSRALVIRKQGDRTISLSATDATQAKLPALSLRTSTPMDFSWMAESEQESTLVLPKGFHGSVASSRWKLSGPDNKDIPPGDHVNLSPGKYRIHL